MISTLSLAGFVAKTYLPSRLTATPYGLPYWSLTVLVLTVSAFPGAAVVVHPGTVSAGRATADALAVAVVGAVAVCPAGVEVPFAAGAGGGFCRAKYAPPPPAASTTTTTPASTAGE